jgi:hypothetical protein
MDARWKPVIAGILTGLGLFVLPEGLGPLILVVGALAAGWVLAGGPMLAAMLFLAPAILLGAPRLLMSDDRPAVGGLLLALVIAVAFVAIFTHLGAGIALRRQRG